MSRSAFQRLNRRTLLAGAAGTAIALPWLEAFAPRRALAADARPTRFIVMFTPNGLTPSWTPSGAPRDFTLSPSLAALAPHQNDIVVLRGLTQQGGGGDGHQNGMGGMLTGTKLNSGTFAGTGAPPAGWASGPSVDQRIADAIGGVTKLRSLELGVQVGQADNWGRMCYRASNQPLPPEDDPSAVYARVFEDLHTDPARLAALQRRRQSILDTVSGQYQRISGSLSGSDRQRLEAHLDAVRDIEQRLTRVNELHSGTCFDPVVPTLASRENDAFPQIGELQLDLLVMALACDITRVASLQWSRSVSMTRFTWLGINDAHHDISHLGDDDAAAVDKLTRIDTWYIEQLASLIDKLKAVPDGSGTLFDSTLILFCNELAQGNTHSRKNAGYVLAGGANSSIPMGRFLHYDGDIPHNDLLVSLLQAFGLPDQTFGNPEWCNGPLDGLV
ncbi:MAG TPA: DUF1552 domain-containing protein [Polyangiaceae bacterium]|nr:DUF1552 domain-containing protein [Polyangiaceae bacterium]